MKQRRLIFGDVHGNYECLVDALQKANFDQDKDMLYGVGDYVDGHPDSKKLIEFLSKLPNFQGVIGNHDVWFKDWAMGANASYNNGYGEAEYLWYDQGGKQTLQSYGIDIEIKFGGLVTRGTIPEHHLKFLKDLELFIELDDQRILIIHAGYVAGMTRGKKGYGKIQDSSSFKENVQDIYWDRTFWWYADNHKNPDYDKVFIGHTQNNEYPECKKGIIWNIDSGAGFDGTLTVMDIDTLEYWKSEPSFTYYDNFKRG